MRDRFGIKPLFYAWHEGALYLASEVHAMMRDTLRGQTLASLPFFDQPKIVDLLDRLDTMDEGRGCRPIRF